MELVNEIRAGNGAAFRTFYYRHVDNIYGMVTRIMGPSRRDREEAVQKIFFKARESMDSFLEPSAILTNLFRIASDITYSMLLSPSSAESMDVEEPSSLFSLEGPLDAKRAVQRMYDVLDQLSVRNRMVFVLYEFQGLTLNQISEVLSISVNAAASRLRRSREQITPLMQAASPPIQREEK
jgi:RNA polymerase sigma-70 factor (ECF subfamily)